MNNDKAADRPSGRVWGVVAIIAVGIILSSCAQAPTEDALAAAESGLATATLLQVKGPVQLVRNESASRVPRVVVRDLAETTDESVSCRDESADPEGLARSWRSTASFVVTNSRAAIVENIIAGLAESFMEQGWKAEMTQDGGQIVLTSASSPATLELTAVERGSGKAPGIVIDVTGPCVLTGGPESEEVLLLEARD